MNKGQRTLPTSNVVSRTRTAGAWLLIGMLALTGCQKADQAGGGYPAVEVTTVTATPKDTPVTFEFVGQTESSRQVEIRARVEGFLEKRSYQQGGVVHSGQVMFQMDRKPFEAALQAAEGELAQQEARLATAKANLGRIRPLAEQNAASKKDLDDATGQAQAAGAAVISAQAKVRVAEFNLGYTTIVSPLTGLAGRANKQEGSFITAGQDGLLTYVAQVDPIYVNFSISENEILRVNSAKAKGSIVTPKNDDYETELVLADGSIFPHKGRINFADPSFSQETGTFLVRAQFANPKGNLRPGQFVRIRLNGAIRPKAILVPQRAVQQGAKGHFVWVIDKDGNAVFQAVQVGEWHGDAWFIDAGLQGGERVVVDGTLKVAPGAPVKIVEDAAPQSDAQPKAEQPAKKK
jgi:membrane fusion protein (multidrug efflux system)